jgi:hypothetical protein
VNPNRDVYQWTRRDRVTHLLPAVPLVMFYIGTSYLLAMSSTYLLGFFLLLWVATNVAVAGICAGCPYRGGYCPGVCQLYFAPFLSLVMYKDKETGPSPRSRKINLVLLGAFGFGSYVFAFYWLFLLYWRDHAIVVLTLLVLLLVHMPLSFFVLCPKCGHNDACPMARVHKAFKKGSHSDGGGEVLSS